MPRHPLKFAHSAVAFASGLYEGGIYRVHVMLPATYPYKSPSIGFQTKIFHPNVDEASGSVCLDVINQTWSPMYDLVNIFSVFLPQLLLYPNPADPLNGAAAALMFKEPEVYKQRIRAHVQKHAMIDFKLAQDEEDEEEEAAVAPTAAASGTAAAAKATAAAAAEAAADDAEDDEDEQAMSSEDEAANMSDLDDEVDAEAVQA